MRINLHEIPEEGKQFVWNRNTGELNMVLSDIIKDTDYSAEFFIRPINSRDYEMTGTIVTLTPETCSRCGLDFNFPINEKFHEILIPRQPDDRTGKYARVNHVSEASNSGPSVAEYDSNYTFDMGEYLHEQVAIALPFNPAPPEKANGDCSLCEKPVRGKAFNYDEEMPQDKNPKPFEILKNLKIQ